MAMFNGGDHVHCPAFGYGTVTMRTDDDQHMFVKFHSEGVPEMIYHANGHWREVTEDSYYDLVPVSRYQLLINRYLDRAMWATIGYMIGAISMPFLWR